jgi:hypothetical protein
MAFIAEWVALCLFAWFGSVATHEFSHCVAA